MFRNLKRINFSPKLQYSNISNAFNTNNYTISNRKYVGEKLTGLFGLKDLKYDSGLEMLKYKAESECQMMLKEALSSLRSRKIVQILDDISDTICQVADLSECMRLLHPDKQVQALAGSVSYQLSHVVEKFNTNRELFLTLDKVVKTGVDVLPIDDIDKRVAELLHRDFEASGIHLNDKIRQQFVDETQKAIEIGSEFHAGCETPIVIPASMLSGDMQKKLNLQPDQRIEISHPFTFDKDPYVRELGYRTYFSNIPTQEKLLRSLMETRHNVAKHAGFSSFSERANLSLICESKNNVIQFINDLSWRLLPCAEEDRLWMLRAKYGSKITRDDIYRSDYQILPWDFQYYLNLKRQQQLIGGYGNYTPYLSLGACMEGINQLFDAHFGLQLEVEECVPGELWHPDVFKVAVRHRISGHVGTVYCDLFARQNKPVADCHYTVRAGRYLNEKNDIYQTPIVVLHSSLVSVSTEEPSLVMLTPPAVQTLFHEWGHAIHSLLTRTRYQHVAGTRCSTDLAEAPSTLMEFFALDPRVVSEYARHYKTNAKLSPQLLNALGQQRYVGTAIEHQLTLVQSMIDQQMHGDLLPLSQRESSRLYNDVLCSESLVPGSCVLNAPSHSDRIFWPQRFAHMLNYGAKFYSYLMSSCIAGCIWKNGFSSDPWSSNVGEKYKRTILQHGGEFKPLDMITNFIGAESKVTVEVLVNDFVDDLNNNYEK